MVALLNCSSIDGLPDFNAAMVASRCFVDPDVSKPHSCRALKVVTTLLSETIIQHDDNRKLDPVYSGIDTVSAVAVSAIALPVT